MDIPEEFVNKLIEETDIYFLKYDTLFFEDNFNKILEQDDLSVILKILKYKLIAIHKKQTIQSEFDIEKLINRVAENDFTLLHNIIFHSLIIQPTFDTAAKYLSKSCYFLNNLKDKNNILYHLEIIDVVLDLSILIKKNIINEIEEDNSLYNLIINLISTDDNNIRRKVATDIIPKYVTCTQNYNLFSSIWKKIKNSYLETCILLALEKYFIPKDYSEANFNILNSNEYWINIQKQICTTDYILKKNSHYLLKKSIQSILNTDSYIQKFIPKVDIIKWESNNFEEYKNAWKNFFILCEVSNEKQIHLIEPTFKLYNSLKLLHNSWRCCVTKLFIFHPHSAVVRLTIMNILKGEWYCYINLLIQGLNNTFLYENSVNNDIIIFLNLYVSRLNQDEYLLFINAVSNGQMSPVPFYHACKTIALSNLNEHNLKIIINLININEKVPHLYIRKGVYHSLFSCFVKILANLKYADEKYMENIVKIIYLFHFNNYLQRGNFAWKILVELLLINKNIYEIIISMNFINNFCLMSKEYSVFIVLLVDTKILSENWIKKYLQNIVDAQNDICKLDYFKFLFDTINATIRQNEIFDDIIFSEQEFTNIFNELFNICNQLDIQSYNFEFFDTIEYIFDTILYKIFLSKDYCQLYTLFLEKLKNENKILCYMILSKKVIQAYELNLNVHKINCEDELTHFSANLKEVKINYNIELKKICNENNIKQKLFINYYYTKLNAQKLLFKIRRIKKSQFEDNILEKVSKYYDKGGLEIIISVIDTLNTVINNCYFSQKTSNFIAEFLKLLNRCEKDIFNLRSNELFRPAINKFISTILHSQMFQHDTLKEYVNNFCLTMFNSSQIITGIRNEILCRIYVYNLSPAILVEGLLFGQILRKDQRIEFETCNVISQDIKYLNFDIINPCQLDGKVRSKSVSILLSLIYNFFPNFNEKQYCEEILKLLIERYNESVGKRYFGDSQIHLVKLRIFQSLHLLVPKLKRTSLNATAGWLLDCLVNESHQPSIKMIIQWLLVRIYDILKEKESVIHNLIYQVPNLKGTSCTSIFPLLYHLVKDETIQSNAVYDCIEFLLPYTMGQQFKIRYSAQVTIHRIYKIYFTMPEFSNKYESIFKTITHIINQTAVDKLNDNLTYYNLSPSIQTIYYDIPRLTNVTQTEWLSVDYFSGIIQLKLRSNDELERMDTSVKRQLIPSVESDNENMNVQKKIDPFVTNLTTDNLENRNNSGNLIVVACLIDKAPNLGGLSRTCEVFGVKQYILNNIQFMKNKEYQSLSMSSEKWIDTLEVKTENLSNYLLQMKKKNYKIIGAEQTSDSKKLDTFKFDKNTVLLLGNEKEGISPNLIHLLDECIEIPQFGQIRSLNVHVAGALFIWEYVKQHCTNI